MIKFLEESEGTFSSQRLVYLIGSVYAMAMGAWIYYDTHSATSALSFVTSVGGLFGLQKVIQKQIEKTEL